MENIFIEISTYLSRKTRDNSEIYFPRNRTLSLCGDVYYYPRDRGEGERHLSVSVHRHRKVKEGERGPTLHRPRSFNHRATSDRKFMSSESVTSRNPITRVATSSTGYWAPWVEDVPINSLLYSNDRTPRFLRLTD